MHVTNALLAALAAVGPVAAVPCSPWVVKPITKIELGPRPYFLVESLRAGPLKAKLASCTEMDMKPSTWSIGHRGGGTLLIPEESRESILAGARMGAGIQECDVTFTKDRGLVCRHSQCDLHTTTNIVTVPELNAKCKTPFRPAANGTAAKAECCTSDITIAEYQSLCSKMDGFNASATTPQDYLHGTPSWRSDLYASCAKVMTLQEHITLVRSLGLKFTPEIKTPMIPMPFQGNYTQEMYAQQVVDTFRANGIPPQDVFFQSFLYADILYLLKHEPTFGQQAVLLDETASIEASVAALSTYAQDGVKIVAPPLGFLVRADGDKIVPSPYAIKAKELGLKIITWSLERSPPVAQIKAKGDYYFDSVKELLKTDGDVYTVLDVLWQQVGVAGVFSDWSATATFYANCFGVGI
ncbi:glycerophosphoryl diester phosphodiesterase family protein [Cordyceps militaris CM01]|uniref:glycerophosphodiester phosphodiesterase n=2 Tax=Cordyceps militaris TaxID=73501 RepID=G3JIL6_CORMM|nr:glycerophosphoryl diester phosphodiesterase family protein [Cordyceps militaris CM01]ATY59100.1 glycerophosphoryl diester phosphodiesterase family [Cordyceps militaris]EGX91913.1 glycerophosphoryl diester phosphodiesterase family protein [Cordyceps militaris CM01]